MTYIEKNGYDRNIGFEPGTHGRIKWKNGFFSDVWQSEFPNLDIRHDSNLTPNRWSKDLFRNKKNCEGWKESTINDLPGWDVSNLKSIIEK